MQPKTVTVTKMEQMVSRRMANQREVVRNRNQASEEHRRQVSRAIHSIVNNAR